MPYTSCHMALWTSAGTWSRQLDLRYFDRLLKRNVTGVATCENPATSPHPPPPLVTCRTTDVTVKLPLGSRLDRVKALRKEGVAGRAVSTVTARAAYVQIPTPADTDSVFELLYVDSAGETSSMLAACFRAVTQRGPERRPRALEEPDLWELWDFDEVPLEPYDPEPTEPSTTEPPATEAPTPGSAETTSATDSDIFSLWGFDEIPDGPFTGDPTTSAPSTTTVDVTTTTTAAPTSTTTTTTVDMTTTTAAPTSTTARTTTRPFTTTRMTPTTTGGVSSTPSPAVTATTSRMMTSSSPWTGAM